MEPASLDCVCVSSSSGINEVSGVVEILMHEAVVGKGQVGLPSICYNECPRTNMSLDYRDEDVVISVIVLA